MSPQIIIYKTGPGDRRFESCRPQIIIYKTGPGVFMSPQIILKRHDHASIQIILKRQDRRGGGSKNFLFLLI